MSRPTYTVDASIGHEMQCGSSLCVKFHIGSFDEVMALADRYEFAHGWSGMGNRGRTWDNGWAMIVCYRQSRPLPEHHDAGAPGTLEELG